MTEQELQWEIVKDWVRIKSDALIGLGAQHPESELVKQYIRRINVLECTLQSASDRLLRIGNRISESTRTHLINDIIQEVSDGRGEIDEVLAT